MSTETIYGLLGTGKRGVGWGSGTYKYLVPSAPTPVSRFGKLVSRGTSVRIRFGSPFSSKVVVCGHCLVTLSLTINETLK